MSSPNGMGHYHHHHHYLSQQLDSRAVTKLLHPRPSLASLWVVPQLWFMFFISASTVLRQVVFSWPYFHFPSGVQWIATLVTELASLHSTCPVQCHHFLVMKVFIFSCWHSAKRSWFETVLGKKMRWIFLRLVVWKDNSLARACSVLWQRSHPYRTVDNTQLW